LERTTLQRCRREHRKPAVKPRLAPKNRHAPTTEGEIVLNSIRNRLTFANVVSVIALFVALGGTTVAASIAANSVGTKAAEGPGSHNLEDQGRRRHGSQGQRVDAGYRTQG
jgi:hypothetical protein